MAIIQPAVTRFNKDSCGLITWAGLAWHATLGTVTCPGGSPTLNWTAGAHGLVTANIGTVMYLAPTGGTAGLYQLTAVGSTTSATFSLTSGNAGAVTGVSCGLGDVGGLYSQPDAALDRTLQVHGTFGASGSLSLYGSNDGINFAVANDNTNAALTCTTTKVRNVFDGPLYYAPMVTAGDGTTSLSALLALRIQFPRAFM